MKDKPFSELAIKTPLQSIPTIEVDIDSIPKRFHGYDKIVSELLQSFHLGKINLSSTIFIYECYSINFDNRQTYSVFIGVSSIDDEDLIILLHNSFKKIL